MAYLFLRSLKIAISFSNLNFIHVERVTTHYHTLQTWIGHNAIRYHNLNSLPHALPYVLSDICLVLDYLQRVTTRYHHFLKKTINIYFFVNLTVTRGNALQIALNHSKLSENVWYCVR